MAEDYLAAGLQPGMTGTWNGVRFVITEGFGGSATSARYNMNDLAKFFGINRTFRIEIGENDFWVIEEK
jgi:hypothetical protein